jgi:hypothetical protein
VDSFSIFPLLSGNTPIDLPTHPYVIHHSSAGFFAIRQGKMKFVACKGSGGWSKDSDGRPAQLYDLASDPSESVNLIDTEKIVAKKLADRLQKAVEDGRSRPGPRQKNDVPVDIWKTASGRPEFLQ